jgi:hypothetical protein
MDYIHGEKQSNMGNNKSGKPNYNYYLYRQNYKANSHKIILFHQHHSSLAALTTVRFQFAYPHHHPMNSRNTSMYFSHTQQPVP